MSRGNPLLDPAVNPGVIKISIMVEMVATDGGMGRKKSNVESVWGLNKPRILLVEDDKVCARIGSKFLQNFECGVETAVSSSALRVRPVH